MAVLPKKYSKNGRVSVEDYIIYMGERLEFNSQVTDKKILELERSRKMIEEQNKALGTEVESLKNELVELKNIIISGGVYVNHQEKD